MVAGNFLWNSGVFFFKARVVLDEMVKHASRVVAATEACWAVLCQENAASDYETKPEGTD